MKKRSNIVKTACLALTLFVSGLALVPGGAYASPASDIQGGVNAIGGNQVNPKTGKPVTLADQIKTIVNTMLYVLGAIAVIMIVIGGIRYITSNGESANVTSAKNTILYAVVGLIVAILAYAIVNFVITSFVK